ncbi:PAS domain S-box protein [Chitinispirillales bacterium ANBcel5]|uniref:PAS domain S-box protein n=1 Tax=Cellulosispirillum alkaliphilum TaxID=3039283 RepID=UPI002A524447|nr:PAS domain S-box protein [Chitinispirillales bacterium ANBcel5]
MNAEFSWFDDTTPAVFITDSSGNITSINESARRFFRINESEVCNKPYLSLFSPEYTAVLSTEVASEVNKSGHCTIDLKTNGKTNYKNLVRVSFSKLSGCAESVESMIAVIASVSVSGKKASQSTICNDECLKEKVLLEENLRISEQRSNSLIKNTTEGFYLFEFPEPISISLPLKQQIQLLFDSTLVECNDAQAKMYGYESRDQIIGKSYKELAGGTFNPQNISFFTKMVKNDYCLCGEITAEVKKEGETVWFSNSAKGVIEHNKLIRIWGTQVDVSGIKRTEEKLREQHWRLQTIIEATGIGTWEYNVVTEEVLCNETWAKILGYTLHELTPLSISTWKNLTHPDDLKGALVQLQRHLKGEIPMFNWEIRMRHKSGAWVWILNRGKVISRTPEGDPLMLFGTVTDISEQKAIEQEIMRERDLSNAILESLPGAFYIFDQEGHYLRWNTFFENVTGYNEEEVKRINPLQLFRNEEKELVTKRIKEVFERGYSEVEASFYDRSGRSRPFLFTGRRIEYKGRLCLLGMGIDISKRKEAEIKLLSNEENLRITLNSIADGVIATDRSGKVVRMNPAAENLTGWNLTPALGKPVTEVFRIVNAQTRATVQDPVSRVFDSGAVVGLANHTVLISRNNTEHQITDSAAPIRSDRGEIIGVVLVFRDVTQQYKTQQRLAFNEERFRIISKLVSDFAICYRTDKSGHLKPEWMFGPFELITGYKYGELENEDGLITIIHPHDRDDFLRTIENALKSKKSFRHEYRIIKKTGETGWIQGYGISDEDREQRLYYAVEEITERKQSEERLREVRERMEFALQASQTGAWELDFADHFVYRTLEHDKIFGYNELLPHWSCEEFLNHVHPQDKDTVDQKFKRAVALKHNYDIECRIIRADNKERWIKAVGQFREGSEGKGLYLAGIVRDITDSKNYEIEIKAWQDLMEYTIRYDPNAIAVLDKNLNHKFVSDRFKRDYRVEDQELTGKNHYAVFPDLPQKLRTVHKRALSGEVIKKDEDSFVRNDGTIEWVRYECRPWYESSGSIGGIILYTELITERKNTEIALKESEERFRNLIDYSPDAIFVYVDKRIVLVNKAAVRLFRAHDESELLGKSPFELYHPDYHQIISERLHTLLTLDEPVPLQEEKIMRLDGTSVYVDVLGAPFNFGNKRALHVSLRDVSERKKTEDKLKQSLREKETLLQEIYHRTKNNMQVISSFLELQGASSSSNEVNRIVNDSVIRIRTMALAHEKLYKAKSLSRINLKDYIKDLVEIVASSNKTPSQSISVEFDLQDIESLIDIAIPCGLIINELISNCYKYAFPEGRSGTITISLRRLSTGNLFLSIEDNGVGLPKGFDVTKTPTLGIQIVLQITRHQLHGSARAESNGGLHWSIEFSDNIYETRV